MGLTRKNVLKIFGGAGAAAATAGLGAGLGTPGYADQGRQRVVNRDVCVLGGGSSGTYTAVRLRDLGRSVVVVEQREQLGGHTETFHDPVTGGTTDVGVIVFHDLPLVRDYFARFGVPLTALAGGPVSSLYVDFRTGRVVPGYTPPAPTAIPAYLAQLQRFPYLDTGFDLPNPVPADLLLPFGTFVRKYALDSVVAPVFAVSQGLGDLLRQPTLYVLKVAGIGVMTSLINGTFLTTSHANNHELYEKAAAFLGGDALLRSTVVATERRGSGVRVFVNTPDGPVLVRAKKLVVTVPPLLGNLTGVDLDSTERGLLGQFRSGAYYTGLLRVPGLSDQVRVENVGADTAFHVPPMPGVYAVYPTGLPGLHHVKYGSNVPLPEHQVRANIAADVRRLASAGTLPVSTPEFALFKSHTPFSLTVGTSAIAGGFYRGLTGLQGHNNTFYNGAAFESHNSSQLWRFTEALLPRLAA